MRCPLCASEVLYQGLHSIECSGPECQNYREPEGADAAYSAYSAAQVADAMKRGFDVVLTEAAAVWDLVDPVPWD